MDAGHLVEIGVVEAEIRMHRPQPLVRKAGGAAHHGRDELRLVVDQPGHVDGVEIVADPIRLERTLVEVHDDQADLPEATIFLEERGGHAKHAFLLLSSQSLTDGTADRHAVSTAGRPALVRPSAGPT